MPELLSCAVMVTLITPKNTKFSCLSSLADGKSLNWHDQDGSFNNCPLESTLTLHPGLNNLRKITYFYFKNCCHVFILEKCTFFMQNVTFPTNLVLLWTRGRWQHCTFCPMIILCLRLTITYYYKSLFWDYYVLISVSVCCLVCPCLACLSVVNSQPGWPGSHLLSLSPVKGFLKYFQNAEVSFWCPFYCA